MCLKCQKQGPRAPPHAQSAGGTPLEDDRGLQGNATSSRMHISVGVCTFSGWVEAFPTLTDETREVARCPLKEIIPRCGTPVSIGSMSQLL
jgi:hypothetical protein